MKRFLILLLAVLLAASFVACDAGTEPTDTTAAPTEEATTEAPTEEETTEEVTTEAPTEEETTEEEITLPPEEDVTTDAWSEPEDAPYDRLLNPVISSKNMNEI